MSAVSSTIMMASTSGCTSAATQSDSCSSKIATTANNSNSAVDGANVSGNKKSQLATPEPNISGNLSSNSSINSTSAKSGASKTKSETTPVKRKALSSSRQKKFHRHFPQVVADEEVINCKFT